METTAAVVVDPVTQARPGLSWRRLLTLSTAASLLAILVVAVVLSDPEAAAIAVGFGVGWVLLRWRRGVAGRVLLGLLFVDVLAWMSLGAVTNIRGGETLAAVAVPAVLTGISVTGLIATVAEGRVTARWGPGAVVALGTLVVVAAVAAGALAPAAPTTAADVRVVSEDVAFDAAALDVDAGQITVELVNRDLFWHTFTIDELGVDLAVPVNGERQATFEAASGTYRFYCRIPGHETRMAGTLSVR